MSRWSTGLSARRHGIAGPKAAAILQRMTDFDVGGLKRMLSVHDLPADAGSGVLRPTPGDGVQAYVTRSGYTGRFEVLVAASIPVRNAILEAGCDGIRPCGVPGTTRLAASCRPAPTSTGSSPPPADGAAMGPKWEHDFVGKEALLQQRWTVPEAAPWSWWIWASRHGHVAGRRPDAGAVTSGSLAHPGKGSRLHGCRLLALGQELEVVIRTVSEGQGGQGPVHRQEVSP